MTAWTRDELTRIRTAEELEITALRRDDEPTRLRRRSFLRGALAGVVGAVIGAPMSGCSESSPRGAEAGPEPGPVGPTLTGSRVLLAYFSRAGENYYYGGRTRLEVGNTEVLAGMISRLIGCDVHRIEPVDPYPDDYSETVERNVREQRADARPRIANPPASIERYDTILLGSPIWNVRAPMIMSTFAERFDFTGKTIFPFTTHAMSGLGTTARDYAASCPGATLGEGLAGRGEEVMEAGAAVESWLRRIDLLKH
jgi:flavodoxin